MKFQNRLTVLLLALCFGVSLMAQDAMMDAETQPRADRITTTEPVPKKSPMNSASVRTDAGYARVVYSQPMLRGRQMLGDQVSYGKVWRAGANEATELFTTAPLEFEGQKLPAGAYSVFIIPQADKWTIVFNKDLGQWGAYSYDKSHDALRVDVPVKKNRDAYEAYTMFFEKGNLVMTWGTTRVEMPVVFSAAKAPMKLMKAVKAPQKDERN
ncbi:MAG: DUF2911 domain-containing protein [Saprospiraceae bacterium]